MRDELKPCPFCGGKAAFEYAEGSYGYYPAKMRVKCGTKTCWGQTQYFPHGERDYDATPIAEAKAITAWNTRAESDRIEALNAEVARLKALLDERDKFIVSRDLWGAFTDTLGDEA